MEIHFRGLSVVEMSKTMLAGGIIVTTRSNAQFRESTSFRRCSIIIIILVERGIIIQQGCLRIKNWFRYY